jgi:hypothetical protein
MTRKLKTKAPDATAAAMVDNVGPLLLDVQQAAEFLGVSVSYLNNLSSGEIIAC